MRILVSLLILIMTAVAPPSYGQVEVEEIPFEDLDEERAARDLMREIRCLVCQNQSIEDSDADLAKDLRILVRDRIRAGDSNDEVKSYLVERYGDWVLLEPPVNAGTLILWGSPLLFVLLAALILVRRRSSAAPTPLSKDEQADLDAILGRGTVTDQEQRP